MGLIRNAKADKLASQAKAAYDSGQPVFAVLLNTPMSSFGFSGEVPDWSAMIWAVESQGWVLSYWAASTDAKGGPQAYPVFRRRT